MAWVEWVKVVGLILGIMGAFFWPYRKIWADNEKRQEHRDAELEKLKTAEHRHDVEIASLKEGKVGHEQMQKAIQDLEISTNNKIEGLHNKIDMNHNQYREELNRSISDLKDDLKDYMKDMLSR
jgi:CHASE3 domain sensor protein